MGALTRRSPTAAAAPAAEAPAPSRLHPATDRRRNQIEPKWVS